MSSSAFRPLLPDAGQQEGQADPHQQQHTRGKKRGVKSPPARAVSACCKRLKISPHGWAPRSGSETVGCIAGGEIALVEFTMLAGGSGSIAPH